MADELVVVVPASFPPYYSVDEQNHPQGFAIDAFEAIAARAGLSFHYDVKQTWPEVTSALKNGEADIIPNMGVSQTRVDYLDFTSPIATYPISVFVREGTSGISSVADLAHRKVAMISENAAVSILKNLPEVDLQLYNDIESTYYALISGQVDALVSPETVIWQIAAQFNQTDRIVLIHPPLLEIKRAIGVRKGSGDLRDRLELSLQAFFKSDQYDAIYRKWFSQEKHFWDARKVFWVMSSLMVLLIFAFLLIRHRELVALNASLQQQIDEATQQLSQSNEYLKDLTVTDALTGISNRRAFENSLRELMGRANRYDEPFSMLIFDIDDFKKLNDQYGHDMGDKVLRELVERVSLIVRDVDILCRWGGEEFTILMPMTDRAGAMKMAERCRLMIADTLFEDVGEVTVSLGVTSYQAGDNERKLFKRADDALYLAKSQGKNQAVWME